MELKVEIENIGPVTEFSAELKPGLNLLVGKQGAGKSTILRTLELAAGGDAAPVTKRDGTAGAGIATIGGRTLKINKVTRSEGELGVEGVGDVDLASLHTPRFDKPEARDKARIKSLLAVSGTKGSLDLFRQRLSEAVGEDVADAVLGKVVLPKDPDATELARLVKAAVDSEALESERSADRAAGAEKAELDKIVETCCDTPLEEAKAAAKLARENAGNVKADKRASDESLRVIEELSRVVSRTSVEQLLGESEELQVKRDGYAKAYEAASVEMAEIDEKIAGLMDRAKILAEQKRQAEQNEKDCAVKIEAVRKNIEDAKKAIADIEEKKAAIVVTDEDVAKADAAAEEAERVVRAAEACLSNAAAQERAANAAKEAKAMSRKGRKLREAAGTVASSLADAVAKISGCPLTVKFNEDGQARLYQGDEPFDRMSDGQRWSTIIAMAARMSSVLVIPQSAFGEMSPATRQFVAEQVVSAGCIAVSAVAQDCPLCLMSYAEFHEKGVV